MQQALKGRKTPFQCNSTPACQPRTSSCGELCSVWVNSFYKHLTHPKIVGQTFSWHKCHGSAENASCWDSVSACSRRVVWKGGCAQLLNWGCRWDVAQPMSRGLWPGGALCFGLWNFVVILIRAAAKWGLACYCGEYWWLDYYVSNCCSFLDTQHYSIRSGALRLASKHWFGSAEAIYKISHQATCGWLTWPHHKMRTSLTSLDCVAQGCFPVTLGFLYSDLF